MAYKNREDANAYLREHYKRNKTMYAVNRKRQKEKLKQIICDAKNVPCKDCNRSYPHYVMDFDHVDNNKEFNIASMINLGSPAKLQAEIAKCEVVCSNCHRERTFKRMAGDEGIEPKSSPGSEPGVLPLNESPT